VTAHHEDPITHEPLEDSVETTIDDLLWGTSPELVKGDAIIAYAQALAEIQDLMYSPANDAIIRDKIDAVLAIVDAAADVLAGDPDLVEIDDLLDTYRNKFE
jgi:Ca-activated chloride channel family protein